MTDPEQALAVPPDESPPPEIVLAAVRGFRYRTVAVISIGALATLLVMAVLARFRPGDIGTDAARAASQGAEVLPVLESGEYDGINVVVSEIVVEGDAVFLRYLAWDTKGHAAVEVHVAALETGGVRLEPSTTSFQDLSLCDVPGRRTTTGGWARFESPGRIEGPVSIEVEFLIWPEERCEGSATIEGPYPRVRLHWEGPS